VSNAAEDLGLSVPNIDALDDSALIVMHQSLVSLQHYCHLSIKARSKRKNGDIEEALREEDKADECYRSLPESLRW